MASAVFLNSSNRVTMARMAGDSVPMDIAARQVMASVKRVAARHIDTGNYISHLSIETVPGEKGTGVSVNDRLIVADDPGAGPIEWGHLVRFEGSRRVKWVPGKHIMTKGLAGVKGHA